MFGPPETYTNPTLSTETGCHVLGSLPVGSRVSMRSPSTGQLIVSGYLMMVNVCRCVVFTTGEGDGNFIGSAEDMSLARIYKLDTNLTFQRESPVVWEGVDEDVRDAIMEVETERHELERGTQLLNCYIQHEIDVDEEAN